MSLKARENYYGGVALDPNLLFEGLGNTAGNTNGRLVDTSMYASNAFAEYIQYAPTFTSDVFGTGNSAHVFNANQTNYMLIADSDRFTFSDANGDLPFSIEYLIKPTTVGNCWLPSKRVQFLEWQTYYYAGAFGISCFAENNTNKIIGAEKAYSLTAGNIYKVKFTYDGSGSNTGFNITINEVQQTSLSRYSVGTYTKMSNTGEDVRLTGTLGGYLNGALTDLRIWKGVI